jgi:hypothetical protein
MLVDDMSSDPDRSHAGRRQDALLTGVPREGGLLAPQPVARAGGRAGGQHLVPPPADPDLARRRRLVASVVAVALLAVAAAVLVTVAIYR